jgi:hypothetical protein
VRSVFSGEWTSAMSRAQLGDQQMVKSVVFWSGVTAISHSALYDFARLESVVLPAGCTVVGRSAFVGCKALRAVSLPPSRATAVAPPAAQSRGCRWRPALGAVIVKHNQKFSSGSRLC